MLGTEEGMDGVIKKYKRLHELVLQAVKYRNKNGSVKHLFSRSFFLSDSQTKLNIAIKSEIRK